jgi:hypothetical protein
VSVPPLLDGPDRQRAFAERRSQQLPNRAPAQGSIDAAIRTVIREEVRAELRAALADHRAEERSREGAKLIPFPEAAKQLGLTAKALRSRIERGSIDGALKIGERWHVALAGVKKPETE